MTGPYRTGVEELRQEIESAKAELEEQGEHIDSVYTLINNHLDHHMALLRREHQQSTRDALVIVAMVLAFVATVIVCD